MRAASIVNQNIETKEIIPVGFHARIATSFRHDIFTTLSQKNKVLYLKFERLTRDNLKDCLVNGCRILQITSNYSEKGHMCVEGDLGQVERISFKEVAELFSSKPDETQADIFGQGDQKMIDVLILSSKNNREFAEFFASLKIPHIITFEFNQHESDLKYKIYEDECVEKFSCYFYEELILQRTILEAFEAATDKVMDYLGQIYFEGDIGENVKKIIGEGPILLPKDRSHDEVLFSDSHFPLVTGKVEDISTTRFPNNIKTILFPYTGRKKELYNVGLHLCKSKGFVRLYGAPGIGKTSFALEVGHHLLTRSTFNNGVFYIPLKKLKFNTFMDYNVMDLLKDTIGIDVQSESVIASSFKGKNMLLIFDDFDLSYTKEMDFLRLLLKVLKGCGIACLFVHTFQEDIKETPGDDHAKDSNSIQHNEVWKNALEFILQPFSDYDMACILESFMKLDHTSNDLTVQKLKASPYIKSAEGNPRKLLKSLIEKHIKIDDKVLKIDPTYIPFLDFEQEYLEFSASNTHTLNLPQPMLQKYNSSLYYDPKKFIRSPVVDSWSNLSERKGSRDDEVVRSPFLSGRPFSQSKVIPAERSARNGHGHYRKGSRHLRSGNNLDVEDNPLSSKRVFENSFEILSKRGPSENHEEEEEKYRPINVHNYKNSKEMKYYKPHIEDSVQNKSDEEEGGHFLNERLEKARFLDNLENYVKSQEEDSEVT